MTESMDIAFSLVNISSKDQFFPTITYMLSSIINPLLENQYDLRLASIQVQPSVSIVQPFTRSIQKFVQDLTTDPRTATQSMRGKTIPICDVLREGLNFDWRAPSEDRCHENVMFLITDGLPCSYIVNPSTMLDEESECPCDELWSISNQFIKKNLTLVIIGVGPFVSLCDNLYGSISQNTGGEYIPLTNAGRVLFWSIQSVIHQGYTLSQSLRHIKRDEFEKNSSYYCCSSVPNTKHSQMMALKGAWLMHHADQMEEDS